MTLSGLKLGLKVSFINVATPLRVRLRLPGSENMSPDLYLGALEFLSGAVFSSIAPIGGNELYSPKSIPTFQIYDT